MVEEIATHDGVTNERKAGHCPVCDDTYDGVAELTERQENGTVEQLPGVAYSHTGGGFHVEWADGRTE